MAEFQHDVKRLVIELILNILNRIKSDFTKNRHTLDINNPCFKSLGMSSIFTKLFPLNRGYIKINIHMKLCQAY